MNQEKTKADMGDVGSRQEEGQEARKTGAVLGGTRGQQWAEGSKVDRR